MAIQTEDDKSRSLRSRLDIEKLTRILSYVAIPVMIAVFGWVIQNRLSERSVSQEYVKIAVSILEKPKTTEVPSGLRDWAVDLLTQNSPTQFSSETIRQLRTGEINLSGFISNLIATSNNGGGIAVSPDNRTVATGQTDGQVAIWDRTSGRQLRTLMGHTGAVVAVVYTPDARMLYSGSSDSSVILWELETGQMLRRFQLRSPVVGLAVTPDGKSVAIRSFGGDLQMWDITSGRLLSEVQLREIKP